MKKTSKPLILLAATTLALTQWSPAFGCTIISLKPARASLPTPRLHLRHARALVPRATFVDVAVAVLDEPIVDPGVWDRFCTPPRLANGDVEVSRWVPRECSAADKTIGRRFVFRVEERIKGSSAETFELRGHAFNNLTDGGLVGYKLSEGRLSADDPFGIMEMTEKNFLQNNDGGSCNPAGIRAHLGARYLIFRDQDQRLLNNGYSSDPYTFIKLERPSSEDWLNAVRRAAGVRKP